MDMITPSRQTLMLSFLLIPYIYGIILVSTIYYGTSIFILRFSCFRHLLYIRYSSRELILLAYEPELRTSG